MMIIISLGQNKNNSEPIYVIKIGFCTVKEPWVFDLLHNVNGYHSTNAESQL